MKIVEYDDANNLVVEFQDNYRARVHTTYQKFRNGVIKNPYHPSVYEVGMIGMKYPSRINDKHTKEYEAWRHMLGRCFDKRIKKKQLSYKSASCCEEWLVFENFYEWLHSQENFDKWLDGNRWCLDKDILVKGNKIYSPQTCCLVPNYVNVLFTKRNKDRGLLPIGVVKQNNGFRAECNSPFEQYIKYIGMYPTSEQAFYAYKEHKEDVIKQVAKIEYANSNITKHCYEAMINYIVEITD